MFDPLLSIPEFAEKLRIKPSTVRAWIMRGRFGLIATKVGRRSMLRESDIYKVINAGEKRPAGEGHDEES